MALAPGRTLALRAFGRARRSRSWVRDALRECAPALEVSERDSAFAWRVAMGATLARGFLEARVREHVKRPSSLEPRVRDALILGAFELGYLSTPTGVVVSQWVDAVKAMAPRASGLANAVLRKLAPLREEVRDARVRVRSGDFEAADLERCAGIARWLAERLMRSLGKRSAATLALDLMDAAPTWLVATTRKARVRTLERANLDPHGSALPGIWRIESPSRLEASGVLREGFAVEDHSAFEIALASVPSRGALRLEVGAGRATKALVAARASANGGAPDRFTCVDASEERVEEARRRFLDAGLEARILVGDGRLLDDLLGDERFGMVFLDAPCSGTGTMRRHPEIAWNLEPWKVDPDAPGALPALQLELLKSASRHVEGGGFLLYATCSALDEENERVVRAFLGSAAGADFERGKLEELPIFAEIDSAAKEQLITDGFSGSSFFPRSKAGGPDLHYLAVLRPTRA